jgi:TatD DNase family protein
MYCTAHKAARARGCPQGEALTGLFDPVKQGIQGPQGAQENEIDIALRASLKILPGFLWDDLQDTAITLIGPLHNADRVLAGCWHSFSPGDRCAILGQVLLGKYWDCFMFVIDSHCHLDRYPDVSVILERARKQNVGVCLAISTSQENFEKVKPIAQAYAGVYAAAGVHPCDVDQAQSLEDTRAWLYQAAEHPKVIALGETGLDVQQRSPCLKLQEAYFQTHIDVACDTGLPLVVHTRNSDALFLEILERQTQKPRGVLHCFGGTLDCALRAIAWGWKVSLSGILTFKNAPAVRDMAKALPKEALLVETDAPWLAPEPFRGHQNEPALVVHTLAILADLHQESVQDMAAITTGNFYDLFPKASADHVLVDPTSSKDA